MPRVARILIKTSLIVFLIAGIFSLVVFVQLQNEKNKSTPTTPTPIRAQKENTLNGILTADGDFTVGGEFVAEGGSILAGAIKLPNFLQVIPGTSNGYVLSVDQSGYLVLVNDKVGITTTIRTSTAEKELPTASKGGMIFYDGTSWKSDTNIYNNGGNIGLYTSSPASTLHIDNNDVSKVALIIQGESGQTASLTEWRDSGGVNLTSINAQGKLSIRSSAADHSIELFPTGNAGYLSSNGGSIFIDNTNNIGTGIGIYSNAGSDALGNMINVKVDNPLYSQAAFYMNYDGNSNAVEIVSNSSDSSSNALSVTGNNFNDSTVGFIGYELGKGTLKITHNRPGTSNDANASGLSIDLKGSGTRAQGIYVDSTEPGGTLGNLLRLRNDGIDRFVVDKVGAVSIGGYGTNTSVTKYGNTTNDQFFIGTNGAFRIQRAVTDSEAFRTQVAGDTQGRWLGTSDGKLKFGNGSAAQDVLMQRIGVGMMQVDPSMVLTGNLGLGVTSFDTSADNLLAIANGTAPSASIANGVQLWAEDIASSSELRVRDEAGNISTLSPHNFSLIPGGPSEDMAWSFYSEHDDMAINADMLKALRVLEGISGEQLVYMKNLRTGEYISPGTTPAAALAALHRDETLKKEIDTKLAEYVLQKELNKHASLGDRVWQFISDVVFQANAIFKGSITVNADTGGTVTVPAGTSSYSVTFTKSFTKKPLIYISSNDSSVKHVVADITPQGFRVVISNPSDKEMQFQWLALLSEDNNISHVEVVDSSKNEPTTIILSLPTPDPSPSSATESETVNDH
jgi:hypothetical protein